MLQPVKEKIILGIDPGTTIMGYGSLTFKWDISTPLEDYSEDHVKYEDGLTLTKNTDGTYTIKKAE